jgi:hypothetical protein
VLCYLGLECQWWGVGEAAVWEVCEWERFMNGACCRAVVCIRFFLSAPLHILTSFC